MMKSRFKGRKGKQAGTTGQKPPDDDIDADVKRFSDKTLILRAIKYLLPYKFQFAMVLVITVINAFIRVYPAVLLKDAIDLADGLADGRIPFDRRGEVYVVGINLVIFYVAGWLLTTGNQYFLGFLSQHTTFDLRQEMFIKLQALSFSYYDKRKAGKIMSRVMSDVDAIHTLMTNGFPMLVGDSISIVYIVYLLFAYSWQMTLIVFLVGPLILIFTKIISARARKIYTRSRQAIAEVYTKLEQGVSGMKTTMAFTREEESAREFDVANKANMEVNIEAGKLMATVGPIFQAIGFGILAVVLVAAFFFMRSGGNFEIGSFIAFILLVLQFYGPINQLAGFYNQIQNALASGGRIFTLLDDDVEVKDAPGAIKDHVVQGDVSFDNVSFHYEPGIPVLKDVNVHVPQNRSLAIVGYTGAGKTTFINLLCRFYDVVGGKILVDGIDIREFSLECLRKQLGIVLQHPFLFTDTVMENIRYGSNASDEEVIAVAKQIGAHDFIMNLEHGYQTEVKERGVVLSQGQRQLISFARALLADPRILILDEATSALDSYSEMMLQKAIEEITKNRTSFIIAHRLSTIRNAHEIIVLEKGVVVEHGTHDELLDRDGLYAKLYKLQFRDLELLDDTKPTGS